MMCPSVHELLTWLGFQPGKLLPDSLLLLPGDHMAYDAYTVYLSGSCHITAHYRRILSSEEHLRKINKDSLA